MNQQKIKILYTIPNFDTAGSGKVVYDLVKNLDKTEFEPEICCFHNKGAFFKEVEKLNVKIHLFSFEASYRPFLIFPFRLFKIIRFFKKHQFDIIHSWHWSSDFSEPLAARLAGIPFVYAKKSMGWGNKAWKWRSYLSSKIITINSDMNKFFLNNLVKKVTHIPLGVDTNYYQPQKKCFETPEGLLFEKCDFVIVSISNLLPIKGIAVLIKAVNELNNSKIKLCIVGNDVGDYAQKLKKIATSNPGIYFLGKKLDVRPYLAMADLFVIPTLALGEGLPIAPLEAMASERIVIGSNVSGVKDILQPFPKCLFEPDDVESLKASIVKMMNINHEDRIQLAREMSMHVEDEYSLSQFIDKHAALYKEIMA